MAADSLHVFPKAVQALFEGGTVSGLSDGQLLERFLERRGAVAEAAFSAIVERHGAMVGRVCRGVLGTSDLVDDAVQATFIVLVQRARSVRNRDSLGSWLHGVANRVARCALAAEARRRRHEARAERAVNSPGAGHEVAAIVNEEVARLPERFRSVVVLHYLEGLACEDNGRSLGWPVGTVKSRLARARERLRSRLERRGVTDPAAGVVLAAGEVWHGFNAAFAAGGSFSAPATALAGRVLRMILWKRLFAAAVILCLGGIGAAVVASGTAETPQVAAAEKPGEAKDDPKVEFVIEPTDVLLIEVLQALPGRPISGEHRVEENGEVSLGFYGRVKIAGMTRDEAKTAVVRHLQRYLDDEVLGLIVVTHHGGKPAVAKEEATETDPPAPFDKDNPPAGMKYWRIPPRHSDRVFVDIVTANSKAFYLEGEFWKPGRNLFQGNERIRDIVHSGGGLTPWAALQKTKLVRRPKMAGAKEETIPIDLKSVLDGEESGNLAIRAGDVLIVPKDPGAQVSNSEAQYVEQARAIRGLENRMKSIDDTLLKILSALDAQSRKSALEAPKTRSQVPAAKTPQTRPQVPPIEPPQTRSPFR